MWVMWATWTAAFCNRPGTEAGSSTIRVNVQAHADSPEVFVDRTLERLIQAVNVWPDAEFPVCQATGAPLSRGNEASQPPLVALPILAFAACPMSGHERRFRDVCGTSALPPILTVTADILNRQLRARKRHMHRSKQHHYSITSSARASSVGGTSRPRDFAVLRLITSSYLVGACTGRSAGFSPLRMRST
jgi:hypothetical protein